MKWKLEIRWDNNNFLIAQLSLNQQQYIYTFIVFTETYTKLKFNIYFNCFSVMLYSS